MASPGNQHCANCINTFRSLLVLYTIQKRRGSLNRTHEVSSFVTLYTADELNSAGVFKLEFSSVHVQRINFSIKRTRCLLWAALLRLVRLGPWAVTSQAPETCTGSWCPRRCECWLRMPCPVHESTATQSHSIQSLKLSKRYDTIQYNNVQSKADMNRLNLPHGTNKKVEKQKN